MRKIFIVICLLSFFSLSAQIIWELQDSGTTQNLNSVDFIDAETGIVVGDGGTILRTINGGDEWLPVESGTGQNLYSVCFFTENNAVVVGAGPTLLRSEDSGSNWTQININGLIYDLFSVFIYPEGNGIAGGDAQTILSTNDAGLTWDIDQTDYWGGGFWGAHMVDNEVGFLAGENSIMAPLLAFTTDGGNYFDFEYFYLVDGMVSYEGRSLNCYFFNSQSGIVISRRWDGWGCVTRVDLPSFTTDHYTTLYNSVDFLDNDFGLIVGNNGAVLKTDNGGLVWESEVALYAHFMDVDLPLDNILAYAVGQQGKIAKRNSEVNSFEAEVPRQKLKLWNQPNPIAGNSRSSGTRILFELQQNGKVKLAVYDIKGRLVEILTDIYYTAGKHEIYWNASEQAAGLYICLLRNSTETTALKIIKLD
jgi:photosystem II stability/assembly factor-like uncharacterized protein